MTGAPAGDVAAVRHHYDVGNEFYALWLDPELVYSCAMPDGPGDHLAAAQERKLRWHLDAVGAGAGDRLLDVGCGWGALLRRAVAERGVREAVGLTLSAEQAAWVGAHAAPGVGVRTESWTEHEPVEPYDGIASIGAFEHVGRLADTADERLARYRAFFDRARAWLAPTGALSLQTIAYGAMDRAQASTFIQQEIFPGAELPTLAEITAAAEGRFEIRTVRNDRADYAWTCARWAERLRARRDEAVRLAGPATVARYERYLRQSALGFGLGKIVLLRLVLRPWPAARWSTR